MVEMKITEPIIGKPERIMIDKVLSEGNYSQGKYVSEFEAKLAKYLKVKPEQVVAVNNGSSALFLAYTVLKDENISIPATTFISCGNMAILAKKHLSYVDSDPHTWNNLSGTLGVDLFGNPTSYIPVIEDAAEALGSSIGGKKCGTLGNIGILSFFENKVIMTGEGGALVCSEKEDSDLIRLLRQQGKSYSMPIHRYMGYNFRMTEIQAAVGIAQIDRIDDIVKRKRTIFDQYKESCPKLEFQEETPNGYSNRWLTCAIVPNKPTLVKRFNEKSIPWRDIFPPLYIHDWFSKPPKPCMVSERLWKDGIALPSSPLLTSDRVAGICEVINSVR